MDMLARWRNVDLLPENVFGVPGHLFANVRHLPWLSRIQEHAACELDSVIRSEQPWSMAINGREWRFKRQCRLACDQ